MGVRPTVPSFLPASAQLNDSAKNRELTVQVKTRLVSGWVRIPRDLPGGGVGGGGAAVRTGYGSRSPDGPAGCIGSASETPSFFTPKGGKRQKPVPAPERTGRQSPTRGMTACWQRCGVATPRGGTRGPSLLHQPYLLFWTNSDMYILLYFCLSTNP